MQLYHAVAWHAMLKRLPDRVLRRDVRHHVESPCRVTMLLNLLYIKRSARTILSYQQRSRVESGSTRAGDGLAGGSGKVSFGRRIREDPCLRIQGELYTRSEVVSSPK